MSEPQKYVIIMCDMIGCEVGEMYIYTSMNPYKTAACIQHP